MVFFVQDKTVRKLLSVYTARNNGSETEKSNLETKGIFPLTFVFFACSITIQVVVFQIEARARSLFSWLIKVGLPFIIFIPVNFRPKVVGAVVLLCWSGNQRIARSL